MVQWLFLESQVGWKNSAQLFSARHVFADRLGAVLVGNIHLGNVSQMRAYPALVGGITVLFSFLEVCCFNT